MAPSWPKLFTTCIPGLLWVLCLLALFAPGRPDTDMDPDVWLDVQHGHIVNFNCSNSGMVLELNQTDTRMIQIYINDTSKNYTTVLAVIDLIDGRPYSPLTTVDVQSRNGKTDDPRPHYTPQRSDSERDIGERIFTVDGSINHLNVSWLSLAISYADKDNKDTRMRVYGTFVCSVWPKARIKGTKKPRRQKITYIPETILPIGVPGFEARNESAVYLICSVHIPASTGNDFTFNIIRVNDTALLALWDRHDILYCARTLMTKCDPIQSTDNFHYGRLELAPAVSHQPFAYKCGLEFGGKWYSDPERVEKRCTHVDRNQPETTDCACNKILIGVCFVLIVITFLSLIANSNKIISGVKNFIKDKLNRQGNPDENRDTTEESPDGVSSQRLVQ